MYVAYVLRSQSHGRHYYGHTKDLVERLKKHNGRKVRSTKTGVPWEVVYQEAFESKSEAYKRELFFKSIEGYRFLKSQNLI